MSKSRGRRLTTTLLGAIGVVLALIAAAAVASAKPDVDALQRRPVAVSASLVSYFLPTEPKRAVFGKLRFIGGLQLSAEQPFGGFSGLVIGVDGRRLLSVSDAGFWLSATISYEAGILSGITDAVIGPIVGKDGKVLGRDNDRDVEAASLVSGSIGDGSVALAFERHDRLTEYSVNLQGLGAPLRNLPLPDYVARLKANRGLESLTVIASGPRRGSRLAFSEGRLDKRGHIRGWLMRDRRIEEVFLRPIDGYDVTDLATLPNGDVIVLERRFRWSEGVKMRLRRVKASELVAGAVISGEVLFDADGTYNIDNMEGVAVSRDANGGTIITLISDDNFSFFQRTLLLQFALID